MYKLDKPLYHGTSKASAIRIIDGDPFDAPLYLTENREDAIHYAKAATAYLENMAQENGVKLIADGYAVITFCSVPDKSLLIKDDYNLTAEPDQWKYTKPIRGLTHFTTEYHPLEVTKEEHMRLQCFAIGMWRR